MSSEPRRPARRPDASMTLITSMLERPLDPGYAAAAARREEAGLPKETSLTSRGLIAFVVIIGILIGIAAMQLRGGETNRQRTKASLIERIENEQKVVAGSAGEAADLRAEIAALDRATLAEVSSTLADDVQRLALVTGAAPVRGPGFVITMDDAVSAVEDGVNADPRGASGKSNDVVYATDIMTVVNGLWEVGAEAISINGLRLTSTSAIRFAGEAILVDYRPLTRPYVITAIGDPGTMPAAFADGSSGTYLSTIKNGFGIRVQTVVRKEVTIPASATLRTREARPADKVGDRERSSSTSESTSEGESS